MKKTILALTAFSLIGAVSAVSAADGAAVYGAHCASCHGATGQADTPAGKAMKAAVLAGNAKIAAAGQDDVVKLIKENPKHAAVISKLGADDLNAVAGQVKQLAAAK